MATAPLTNICFESGQRKELVTQTDAVELVFEALRRSGELENVRLHVNACLGLRALSICSATCERITDSENSAGIVLGKNREEWFSCKGC